MQTRDMWKSSKWKVVAGAATLSALGITGMALAEPDSPRVSAPINLRDQATTRDTVTSLPDFVVKSNNQIDLTDLDSPFVYDPIGSDVSVSGDTLPGPDTGTGDTPASPPPPANLDTASADDSFDSPTPTPTTQPAPAPAPTDDSVDSADSVGSDDDSPGS
jgi:hypothetical protein